MGWGVFALGMRSPPFTVLVGTLQEFIGLMRLFGVHVRNSVCFLESLLWFCGFPLAFWDVYFEGLDAPILPLCLGLNLLLMKNLNNLGIIRHGHMFKERTLTWPRQLLLDIWVVSVEVECQVIMYVHSVAAYDPHLTTYAML
jgi:hypothetical protein